MKILIIEDNITFAQTLEKFFKKKHIVDVVHSGEKGLFLAESFNYQTILLDWMLPDISGIEICRELRKSQVKSPILMITGRGDLRDKISGLDAGADDYLVKPFAFTELQARINALARRDFSLENKTELLNVGGISLDMSTQEIKHKNMLAKLQCKETTILELLILNIGMVVSRNKLIDYAWKSNDIPSNRTISVHISNIRKKLKLCTGPTQNCGIKIITIPGKGYLLEETK